MGEKKIGDLQLIDEVTGSLNFASDDTIQSYRVTATQLKDFILSSESVLRTMIKAEERTPVGSVMAFAAAAAPTGWLLCDGVAISRQTYADLFNLIGITHGQGNGTTTFNKPDYRGRFLRMTDGAVGRDPDRATRTAMATGGNAGDNVGSVQAFALSAHTHGTTGRNGSMAARLSINSNQNLLIDRVTSLASWNSNQKMDGSAANDDTGLTDGVSVVGVSASNNAPAASAESRPINANVMYIIKY